MFKIITKKRLDVLEMYQEAWLKENERANKLDVRCVELEAMCRSLTNENEQLLHELEVKSKIIDQRDLQLSPTALHNRIKIYRHEHKLTQVQFAAMMNVSVETLRGWEAGKIPSKDNLAKIREIIGG